MVGGTSWAVLECSTLDAPTLGPGYAGTGGILFADEDLRRDRGVHVSAEDQPPGLTGRGRMTARCTRP